MEILTVCIKLDNFAPPYGPGWLSLHAHDLHNNKYVSQPNSHFDQNRKNEEF